MSLSLESSAKRNVGGREGGVDLLLNDVHPLVAVLRRRRREIVDALGGEEAEAEALVFVVARDSNSHVIAAEAVADEDFAFREAVQHFVVIHELAAVERAPAPSICVSRPWARLVEKALAREISRE